MANPTEFTPLSALAGGVLIGAAVVLLMAGLGRIAGISGIVRASVWPDEGGRAWRLVFLAGLLAAAWLSWRNLPGMFLPRAGFPAWLLITGGYLVGFGTAMSGGCTSGHGVCGLARLSPRSLVATAVFLATGMLTAVIVRHFLGALS